MVLPHPPLSLPALSPADGLTSILSSSADELPLVVLNDEAFCIVLGYIQKHGAIIQTRAANTRKPAHHAPSHLQ